MHATARSPVGVLYVLFAMHGRWSPRLNSYLHQAATSSRTVASTNPQLPTALATNVPRLVRGNQTLHVAWTVIYDITKSLTTNDPWIARLHAIATSPFELTLSLDSSFTVCSGALHAALLREHELNRLDFAFNFENSALTDAPSRGFGSKPTEVESILPHLCAMLARSGEGLRALLLRLVAALRTRGPRGSLMLDDQQALRHVLRRLSRVGYVACDRDAPREGDYYYSLGDGDGGGGEAALRLDLFGDGSLAQRARHLWAVASRLARSPFRRREGCVRVRVWRLREAIGGLKPADAGFVPPKMHEGHRRLTTVHEAPRRFTRDWPLYTRPIHGPMLALHSFNPRATEGRPLCTILNEHAPQARL